MKFPARLLICLATSTSLACSSLPTSANDDLVTQFIRSEILPSPQSPQTLVDLEKYDARLFFILFGPPGFCLMDRPALVSQSCYPSAIGLVYRGRVGWLEVVPVPNSSPTMFQFLSSDEELFGPGFATALRLSRGVEYSTVFTPALIRDEDTPRSTLLRLAGELAGWIWPLNAAALLQRSDVRHDAEILGVIATLPVSQGDAYASSRQEARRLLDSLAAH